MNLNELSVRIAQLEGKKVELSVAQIKEVLLCLGKALNELSTEDSIKVVDRLIYNGKNCKLCVLK